MTAISQHYLLQLLEPSLLADELTVENHRGGAQVEGRQLRRTGLHEGLQVRVELQGGRSLIVSHYLHHENPH